MDRKSKASPFFEQSVHWLRTFFSSLIGLEGDKLTLVVSANTTTLERLANLFVIGSSIFEHLPFMSLHESLSTL